MPKFTKDEMTDTVRAMREHITDPIARAMAVVTDAQTEDGETLDAAAKKSLAEAMGRAIGNALVEATVWNDLTDVDNETVAFLAGVRKAINERTAWDWFAEDDDPEACPGCGCLPGDGRTEGCDHPDGCGFKG